MPITPTKDEVETITLISAVFFATGEDADNGGPFSGEAAIVAFLLGLLAVGTV